MLLVLRVLLREEQLVQGGAAGVVVLGGKVHGQFLRHLDGVVDLGAVLKRLVAQQRPAARRRAQLALQEADDGFRDVVLARVLRELLRADTLAHQLQRQVADDLGGRGHLGRAAEDLVDAGVVVLDELEAVLQTQRLSLRAQVGQLAARDLVLVHAAGRARDAGLERGVDLAHGLPIRLHVKDGLQVNAGVALSLRECGDERGHGRLGGGARQRRRCHVDHVGAGVCGRQVGGQLAAGGVVGVHVHRQVEALAQRGDQLGGGCRAHQARHVLDGQDVGARLDDLLGEVEVVVQRVQVFRRVHQVAGVGHGHLSDGGVGLQHRLDGRAHL